MEQRVLFSLDTVAVGTNASELVDIVALTIREGQRLPFVLSLTDN